MPAQIRGIEPVYLVAGKFACPPPQMMSWLRFESQVIDAQAVMILRGLPRPCR